VSTIGLIMAGGQGVRMQASGPTCPKPLVPVGGVPLLEHNVHRLLQHGIRDIRVSVPRPPNPVSRMVTEELVHVVRALGAEIDLLVEPAPLGNIGSACLLADVNEDVLVVYADNLTLIDLQSIVQRHRASTCTATIAVHPQPFRMPFGEVRLDGDTVRRYVEKPLWTPLVCSAVTVLTPDAVRTLPSDRPSGLSDLVNSLLSRGHRVGAVRHADPWIDVNDAAAVREAQTLIRRHQASFDRWLPEDSCVLDIDPDAPPHLPRIEVDEVASNGAATRFRLPEGCLGADPPPAVRHEPRLLRRWSTLSQPPLPATHAAG
jgi:NDP-mannose synthase